MPRQRPRDPELPPLDLAEFHADAAHVLLAIERLRDAGNNCPHTSVHHSLMNHLGLAERSLKIVQQHLPAWPQSVFGFYWEGNPPDDGSVPPRAA